jgi:hypothetical protein
MIIARTPVFNLLIMFPVSTIRDSTNRQNTEPPCLGNLLIGGNYQLYELISCMPLSRPTCQGVIFTPQLKAIKSLHARETSPNIVILKAIFHFHPSQKKPRHKGRGYILLDSPSQVSASPFQTTNRADANQSQTEKSDYGGFRNTDRTVPASAVTATAVAISTGTATTIATAAIAIDTGAATTIAATAIAINSGTATTIATAAIAIDTSAATTIATIAVCRDVTHITRRQFELVQ